MSKVDLVDTILAAHPNDLQNAVASLEIGGVSTQNIAYAASITPNVPAGQYIIVGILTGNITINAPTNALTGRQLTFRFTQDGTGGRTVTWNAVFSVTNWTVNTAANAKTEATFTYDGSNWVLASSPQPQTAVVYDAVRDGHLKGDGTDEATAINAFLTLASGNIAYFPKPSVAYGFGTMLSTGANTMVLGAGRYNTSFKQVNSANLSNCMNMWGGTTIFSEFTLDGNKANNSGSDGINGGGSAKNNLIRVRIINMPGRGIYIPSGSTDTLIDGCEVDACGTNGSIALNNTLRARVIGCRVSNPTDYGIFLGLPAGSRITIADCVVLNAANIGIALGTGSQFVSVVGCIVDNTGQAVSNAIDHGTSIDSALVGNVCIGGGSSFGSASAPLRVAIIGNTCLNAAIDGIEVYGTSMSVIGNTIVGQGTVGSFGIALNGGQRCVISGNTIKNWTLGIAVTSAIRETFGVKIRENDIYDDQAVKTQTHAIQITSGQPFPISSILVEGNDLRGNINVGINNLANVLGPFRNNLGLNPAGSQTYTLPAIGTVFGNPTPYDLTVFLAGGTITAVGLGGLPLPSGVTITDSATGGTLVHATTVAYRVSAINNKGETLASTEVTQLLGGGADTHSATVKWSEIGGASSYKVYGRTTGAELFMKQVEGLMFVDTGSVTPAGALPGADTTGNTAVGITAAAAAGSVHTLPMPWGSSLKLSGTVNPTAVAIAA